VLSGLSGLSARLRGDDTDDGVGSRGVRGVETIISTKSSLEEEHPLLRPVLTLD
jgi:hypothetical protein